MAPSNDGARAATEGTRLIQPDEGFSLSQVMYVVFSCFAYIGLSSCLINYNKFLMHEDYFPYSVALTSFHMVGSFVLSALIYAVAGASCFPSLAMVKQEGMPLFKKLVPLSFAFAISICLSNEAYLYCSVPFLQMCKELNVVMVYVFGLVLMVEKFNLQNSTILFIIFVGCCLSIHGEMRFSKFGFACQMMAQVAEVMKILLQQVIMQGFKVDPMTMVLLMSPLCLVTLSVGLYFFWEPGIIPHAREHWMHLALNCCNAFALNVAVANLIKHASGVSFVLAGVVKDVCIVAVAATVFSAHIQNIQIIGFAIAVTGVGVHSIVRSMPDMATKHGVPSTVKFAIFGLRPADEKQQHSV